MTQLEQKQITEKEIKVLENTLEKEISEMIGIKENLKEAQDEYDVQYFYINEIRRNIKDLKENIGIIMEGQMSIDDYE